MEHEYHTTYTTKLMVIYRTYKYKPWKSASKMIVQSTSSESFLGVIAIHSSSARPPDGSSPKDVKVPWNPCGVPCQNLFTTCVCYDGRYVDQLWKIYEFLGATHVTGFFDDFMFCFLPRKKKKKLGIVPWLILWWTIFRGKFEGN